MPQRSRQDIARILEQRIKESLRLDPTGENLVFMFSDPGTFAQQTIPPIQAPQFKGQPPRAEPGFNLGFSPKELVNTIMREQAKSKQKGIQFNMQGILDFLRAGMGRRPLFQGRLGPMQFGAGASFQNRGGQPGMFLQGQGRMNF